MILLSMPSFLRMMWKMIASSYVARTLASPVLMTQEMKVGILKMVNTKDYVKAYRKAYGRDPSDADIKDHLECRAGPDKVSWLKPFNTFKADEFSFEKGYVSAID